MPVDAPGLPMLQAALGYIRLKLPIIPICPPDHRGMGPSHQQKCSRPGKTPLLAQWTSRGVPSDNEVQVWFARNPYVNIGLVLGDVSRIIGIDVDGDAGETLLQEQSEGDLPVTWEFKTGDGRRLLYRLPEGAPTKKFTLQGGSKHEELALLATGQQTVLPPSMHANGKQYAWVPGRNPEDVEIAAAPEWLLRRVLLTSKTAEVETLPGYIPGPTPTQSPLVEQEEWQTTVLEGGRNNHLTRLAGSLLSRPIAKAEALAFLKVWNENHCVPPLEDKEIETIVEAIAMSEQMKRAGRAKKKSSVGEVLRPLPLAELFIATQEAKGFKWKYIVGQGMFYRCDVTRGPWAPYDLVFAEQDVRHQLVARNPSWDSSHCVSEVIDALRSYLSDEKHDDVFDIGKHPDLKRVYVTNGMLEWETEKLSPWDPSSNSTVKLPAVWVPEGADDSEPYKTWNSVMAEWIPDASSRAFLQEFVGLCLIPDASFRTAVFLYGEGSNGKSLFLDVFKGLLGSHMVSIPLHRIADRFETAYLQDKLVNLCGDIDPKYLDETGLLKAVIAGDTIRGEYKHGRSFDFTPVVRLIFSANVLPRVADRSEGWYSRWRFVEFPRVFPVDPRFKQKLLSAMGTPEALSALLCWAVKGLQRLHTNNVFTTGAVMEQAALDYRMENDSVLGFVYSCLNMVPHVGAETQLVAASLYRVYSEWCGEGGLKPVGQIEFGKRVRVAGIQKGPRMVRTVSTLCFLGVVLKDSPLRTEYNTQEAIRWSTR